MIKRFFFSITVLIAVFLPVSLMAQNMDVLSFSRTGKHNIQLNAGLLSEMRAENEVYFGSVKVDNQASGFLGSIAYFYWLEDNLAFTVSAGAIGADVSTSVDIGEVTTESAIVIPLLFGIKYQPFRFTDSQVMRPFIAASVGPYMGFASNVRTGLTIGTETVKETVLGGHLACGLELFPWRFLNTGFSIGYHLVGDFNRRIGADTNYSGPEFSLFIGVLLGRGKQ